MAGGETDPENVSWATAALSVHAAHSEVRKAVEQGEHDYRGTALELAPRYFEARAGPLGLDVVRRVMDGDDYLQHQWLTLLRGKDPDTVAQDVIIELNRHPSPVVAEYSIWSMFRDPAGRVFDVAVRQSEVPELQPNVRRWYYRLFTKDPTNLSWPNRDVVEFAITDDPSADAREGFALGLRYYPGDEIGRMLVDWYKREESPLVRRALHRHFGEFWKENELYRQILHAEDLSSEGYGYSLPKLGSTRKELPRMESLRILEELDQQAFIVAVDAVGFSLMYDVDQVRVFRDLIGELSNAPSVRGATPETFVHLLTGDGFILAFLGMEQRFQPIRLAMELRRATESLRAYGLRFGAHAGPARVISLSDGTRQLISSAINWAARVMSAGESNQVLISGEYYDSFVKNSLNEFPGVDFKEVTLPPTKHGEDIRGFEVRER